VAAFALSARRTLSIRTLSARAAESMVVAAGAGAGAIAGAAVSVAAVSLLEQAATTKIAATNAMRFMELSWGYMTIRDERCGRTRSGSAVSGE
jgi:hypothetical protein